MKPSEKYGLVAGAGMLAMFAFQQATDLTKDHFISNDVDAMEQRDDRVVLSPKYGDMLRRDQSFISPTVGASQTLHSTIGHDKNKQVWLCRSETIEANEKEISIAWQQSNSKTGEDEKIAFPKSSCTPMIKESPNTIPQETPKSNAPHII